MTARTGFVTSLALDLENQIDFAADEGLDHVEVLLDGPNGHGRLADRAGDLRARLADAGLDLLVHLPFPTDVGSPYEGVAEGAKATQRTCIDLAAEMGAEKAVLHPETSAWGVAWDETELRDHVDPAVDELAAHGADRGVEVCAENLFDAVYTIGTFDRLLAETDVSMTLDTGHARVAGYDEAETAAFVADHADRISHVHLNDTRRAADEHLPLGAGNLDFAAVLSAFPTDWTGTLSMEVGTDSYDYLRHSREHLADLADEVPILDGAALGGD
jgi:sugar phosphate isomerase/epimerase